MGIITHRRPELLQKCIKSVNLALGGRDIKPYIFWQTSQTDTDLWTLNTLKEHSAHIKKIVTSNQIFQEPNKNIDRARIECLQELFAEPRIQFALILEDDVEISKDTFDFIEHTLSKHHNDSKFRGINLGSQELVSDCGGYSKVRYGIHGPASLISRITWNNSGLSSMNQIKQMEPWDSEVESYLKTGFMVTPNLSRYIDNGINGTHADASGSKYFDGLAASFAKLQECLGNNPEYKLNNIKHSWRKDSHSYRRLMNWFYQFKKVTKNWGR